MTLLIGVLVGVFAGFFSGVAGVGGGVIMIPAMVFFLSLGQTTAQGTSLLAILFTSVAGTVVNVVNRHADLAASLWLGVSGVVGAQVGKEMALRLPNDVLQRLFGAFVILSGLRMGWRAWQARRLTGR